MEKNVVRKKYIKEFYRDNKLLFFASIVFSIALAGVNLLISYAIQKIIDVMTNGAISDMKDIIILCVSIILFLIVSDLIYAFVFPKYIYRATRNYKKYAFKKIIEKDIVSYNSVGSSSYISALTNDLNQIEQNYIASIFRIIMQVIMFVGAFALMFYYNALLTLVAVLFALIPFVVTILLGNKLGKYESDVSNKNNTFVHFVKDSLSGFSTIKSFSAEKAIEELFSKTNNDLANSKKRRRRMEEILDLCASVSSTTSQFGVFLFGVYLSFSNKNITPGVIVVFVQLMNFVVNPIAVVPSLIAKRRAALPLIDKLAAHSFDNKVKEEKLFNASLEKSVEIKDLTFKYDDKTVLDNLNYTFQANKNYALVGSSGSGKSTLINLLMNVEESSENSIAYDGHNVADIKDDSLVKLVSLIEQSVFIFDSTILDNITMYQSFSDEEINNAIDKSGLSDLIKEKGLDYNCGEGGSNLSGGERQRISIARGLLKKSKLLLMDEATSALDNETSISVSQAVLDIKDATKIIITHRLESRILKAYDQILVMNHGKIEETGTFDELLNKKGLFYSMYSIAQS